MVLLKSLEIRENVPIAEKVLEIKLLIATF